jgi:fatty acid desaturase
MTGLSIPAGSGDPPVPVQSLPIPDRLNVALVAIDYAAAIALLWAGSRVESWYAVLGVGVVFSYVLLTNYALLHEATHHNLHSNPRWNYGLGVLTGWLFPVPFSMIHITHQGHHLRNRTDHEMFDLYYPGDSRLLKYGQWYSILCGLFWPLVPIGALLAAVWPGILATRPFQKARSSNYMLGDVRGGNLRALRLELVFNVALFAGLFWLLDLRWQNMLVLYACFAFNWSTRQYVGHAFTRRHVIEGASNLKHNGLMTWILLHGEYDLNHHRRPDVSWYHLPALSPSGEERPGYIRQYWRLWRGPRLNTEPAPEALQELPLSVHQ